ncbi:MAG: C40 family peptidase [Sphingobacteriales bacterium]|nr:C40 family peptidase [Sphingobacteriales bacterium]
MRRLPTFFYSFLLVSLLLNSCVYLKKAPELPHATWQDKEVYQIPLQIPFSGYSHIRKLNPHKLFFDADSLYLSMMDTCIPFYYNIFDGKISSNNDKLVQFIDKWMHTRYRRSGSSLSGTDCSGFVNSLYREVYGKKLSRSSYTMIHDVNIIPKSELQEGDLVFFKIRKGRISHVGFYLSKGYFIHAARRGGVIISSLDEPYYKRTFYAAGRVKF